MGSGTHVNVVAFVFGGRGCARLVHHRHGGTWRMARRFMGPVLLAHFQRSLGVYPLRLGRWGRTSDSGNTHESLQKVGFECNHLTRA
jgi:hypothetical protein